MGKKQTKRLIIFAGFTLAFLAIFSTAYFFSHNAVLLTILMMTPAISVILTRLITKEGWKGLYLSPCFRGNIKWYLGAYLGVPLIALIGAAVYFFVFPNQFDPLGSKFAVESGVTTLPEYLKLLATMIPMAVLINPIMGLIQCFGEEFAWRGYLFPKLCNTFSVPMAALMSSIIWGLWHAPIIAMGYNYGTERPVLGVFAMVLFCLVIGTIQSYLFLKTKSVWVPVVFHAALNGMDLWAPSTLLMSQPTNPFLGPDLIGILGGIGFLFTAIICFIKLCNMPNKTSMQK